MHRDVLSKSGQRPSNEKAKGAHEQLVIPAQAGENVSVNRQNQPRLSRRYDIVSICHAR
jgi:hypothetical protein